MGLQYVRYSNRSYRRSGARQEERHKGSLIDVESYLINCYCYCYCYIELNPVITGVIGFMGWLGTHISVAVGGLDWPLVYVVLLLSYIGIHYFFVSQSAHLPALIPVFLEVGVGGGVPGSLMAFSILFANCIALSSVGIHPSNNKQAKPYAQHLRRKHQGYGGFSQELQSGNLRGRLKPRLCVGSSHSHKLKKYKENGGPSPI